MIARTRPLCPGLLLAAVLLATPAPATAKLMTNTIGATGTLGAHGRTATVTALIECTAGQSITVQVTLTQDQAPDSGAARTRPARPLMLALRPVARDPALAARRPRVHHKVSRKSVREGSRKSGTDRYRSWCPATRSVAGLKIERVGQRSAEGIRAISTACPLEKVRGSNPLSSTKPAGQGRCPSSRTRETAWPLRVYSAHWANRAALIAASRGDSPGPGSPRTPDGHEDDLRPAQPRARSSRLPRRARAALPGQRDRRLVDALGGRGRPTAPAGGALMARPRTPVGAYGSIAVRRRGDRAIAETRIRDVDGRVRHVRVTARTAAQARLVLKERWGVH